MEHPLINDINNLSIDELTTKITDLNRKLSWAARNNAQLAGQIRMVLESYHNTLQKKQQELWNKAKKDGHDFQDQINIS